MGPDVSIYELEKALEKVANLTFIVVGDVMIDESYVGAAHRVSPEAPIPVVRVHSSTLALGGAANVGANLRSLGANVKIVGVVGDDEYGRKIIEMLGSNQIESKVAVVPGRQTTRKVRIFADGWHIARMDIESRLPLPPEMEAQLLETVDAELAAADGVVLSDYAKGVLSRALTQQVIHIARLASKPTYVDPKGKDFSKYLGATGIFPNVIEALMAVGLDPADLDADDLSDSLVEEVGTALQQTIGCEILNVSRGARGSTLFQAGAPPIHIPALPVTVRDVTGAGDSAISTFSATCTAGRSPIFAACLANVVASMAIQKTGTAVISPQEVMAAVRGDRS
jgi:D-beta-D-heptose 7-phosphate kinase/D-beta-D-heptose 1-phosphate adenosyltransferase